MNIIYKIQNLKQVLSVYGKVSVAVSGGVDSMTLAYVANEVMPGKVKVIHAVSSAVPKSATERVKEYSQKYGWDTEYVNAQEMTDINYVSNPVNRCYFCKTSLYKTLKHFNFGQVVSGTNLDDLNDFRPGLTAARELDVQHPFVDAAIDKKTIRGIASFYGLNDIEDLPASPCLASRVETGVRIDPNQLDLIQRIENFTHEYVDAENIRCRVLAQSLVVQIDEDILDQLSINSREYIVRNSEQMSRDVGFHFPVSLAPYVRGSAFKRVE